MLRRRSLYHVLMSTRGMESEADGAATVEQPGVTRLLVRILGGFGVLVLLAVIGLPLWASLRYRSATHALHDELAPVEIASAVTEDVRIERCWNGVGPASVRLLVPVGGENLSEVVADYVDALDPLGFEDLVGVTGVVAVRPRTDDLDDDRITVSIDDKAGHAVVVADPFDADLVTCLPF